MGEARVRFIDEAADYQTGSATVRGSGDGGGLDLDLPPLPGAENDERPVIAVAGSPWRPVDVHAGTTVEGLTPRARVERSATVGALVEPLAGGPPHRWDEARALVVRVEGETPVAATAASVLAGANAVAVRAANGEWEIVQYRDAELMAGDVWRLSGLLRGQQGTDAARRAGAQAGALVVWLNDALVRASVSSAERGLELIWRAVAAGAPPGGATAAEVVEPWRGVQARPLSPCHLRARREDGGVRLTWTSRTRIDGDRWDGEAVGGDPERFRVRILDGDTERRVETVDERSWLYSTEVMDADFPGSAGVGALCAAAQWSPVFGWGSEARARLL